MLKDEFNINEEVVEVEENKKNKKSKEKEVKSNEEDHDNEEENTNTDSNVANIKEMGTMSVPNADDRIQVIPIIGQIEGHNISNNQTKSTKYEHIIPQLIAIERDEKVKGVLVVLNTAGGDVEAGLAIAEMITSLSKPTVSIVIGGGHSIGVPLATATDYSFITPSATMIVHPIRMNGFVIGVSQTFDYFRKMQNRIVEFVVRTSNIDADKFMELMSQNDDLLNDIGTILIGKQAVECGLINEVGGIRQALDKLDELIDKGEKHKNIHKTEEKLGDINKNK